MAKRKHRQTSHPRKTTALVQVASGTNDSSRPAGSLLPLGAMLLAASVSSWAQTGPEAGQNKTLGTVVVKEKAEEAEGKDSYQTRRTQIGKGNQDLRDIPQSITVVTEKLMDDRNLDTLKAALRTTAGISFQAAEGGEEDIKLRGFSLAQTGDIFLDGMRDPAFYDRDTFNYERLEVLRGSASMLFGRGSTGGAVNQVSKMPRLIDENQVDVTLGSYNYRRVTGDFNIRTDENAALRLNVMDNKADNNGAGSSIDKYGVAAAYRWGIGERDEYTASLYQLTNNNGINYGLPWIRPAGAANGSPSTTTMPVDPSTYYGMASDYNKGTANHLTLAHLHRFDDGGELKSQVRRGFYTRDQRASTVRFAAAASQPGGVAANLDNLSDGTVLTRGTQNKIQDMENLLAQSDYSKKFEALGFRHELITGFDAIKERKTVYAALTAAQGGYAPTKPNTTVGTPDDGANVNEAARTLRNNNQYDSIGWGAYMQDLVQVAPKWKVLMGMRYDLMVGDYVIYGIPNNATSPETATKYRMTVAGWSPRLGTLYQPNALDSYHVSIGSSFNTSGDTYSLSAQNADTPPEQSYNLEIGAKLDSADKRFTTRLAAFHSVKYNERNTDPLLNIAVLSGRRHVSGYEIDITGRPVPKWEVFGSFMWLPDAMIDVGAQGAEGQGQRPSLTPIYSGSLWSTYQVTQPLRLGAGINFRGEQTPLRNPGWKVPAYATLDLMTEYRFNERYALKGNVSNVFNTLYADQLYDGHYIPGTGRIYQLTLTVKF